ncbi:MAG: hypothetical protein JJ863_32610 [Deltaproteobacteria bacterium]|nr:hypothetical protein [Deltaproteobacteria bacterium]
MRPLLALVWLVACGGEGQRSATPESAPEAAAEEAPSAEEPVEAAPHTDDGPTWLRLAQSLRYDMEVGVPAERRGSTIAAVETALGDAGGTLDCSDLTWVSDEDGVSERQCGGELRIEGIDGMVSATFRRYEIPEEPEAPGLMHLILGGPFLGDDAETERWLTAVRAAVESVYGPPENASEESTHDLRWRAGDRNLLLHDATRAPCGGLCNSFLWIGGPEDPELSARGF